MSSEDSQNKQINEIKINFMALQKDVDYTKEKVNSIETKLDDFINKADIYYATKKELTNQKDRIIKMELIIQRVMWTAIIALIGFIATIGRELILSKF